MAYETHLFSSQRLARRPSPSCQGTQTARLETAGHCPGLRRERRRRELMDASSRRRWYQRAPSCSPSGRPAQIETRPTVGLVRLTAAGGRSVWLSRRCVDGSSGRGPDSSLCGGLLSSRLYPSSAQALGLDRAKAFSRAQQGDEAVIARWPTQDWPQLKKKPD